MQAIGGNIFDSYAKFRDAFDAHFECPRGGELPVAYVHDGKTTYYSYPATIKGSVGPSWEEESSNFSRECSHDRPGKFVFQVFHDGGTYTPDKASGIYDAINTVRQAIFTALRDQKDSVDIPWYEHWTDQDAFVFQDCEQFQKQLISDQFKSQNVSQEIFKRKGKSCNCRKGMPLRYWRDLVLPTLMKMLSSSGCLVSVIELKERNVVLGRLLDEDIVKKTPLEAIRVTWNTLMLPNYPLPLPKALPPPPKPITSVAATLIETAYENGEGCDFEFVCKDGIVKAHKLVLSLISEYFKNMFSSSMLEAREGKLNLSEYSAATIKGILDYFYKNINPFEQPDSKVNAYQIFTLSHRWRLPLLVDMATNAIGEVCIQEEWQDIGEMGAKTENEHLLKIYNSLRFRLNPVPEIPENIKSVMLKLGLMPSKPPSSII